MPKTGKGSLKSITGGEVLIYQSADGQALLDVRLDAETVWLTQKQMAMLFDTERSVITKHINNVFKSGELDKNSVCAFFAHTAEDGKTYNTAFYNLDAIISVGYRVNSKRGTQFRIWATRILKEHLIKGYTANEKRLKELRQKMTEIPLYPPLEKGGNKTTSRVTLPSYTSIWGMVVT
jgi:hypothetical protein